MKSIERNIAQLVRGALYNPIDAFDPDMILVVLPKLMNTISVSLMKQSETGSVTLHASETALQGYCAFHHLLLKLALRHKGMQKKANDAVEKFLASDANRSKKVVPNLGEWLIYLILSDVPWAKVCIPYLEENLTRNVRWLLKPHPKLETIEKAPVSEERLKLTWTCGKTSYRLLMFQIHFLMTIGRPANVHPKDIAARYDRSYGRPSAAMIRSLQEACKGILAVDYWPEFFDRVRVKRPSPEFLTRLLKNCVSMSSQKGYHQSSNRY